jgi:hypothetical protein
LRGDLDLGHAELGLRGAKARRGGLGVGPRVLVIGGRDEAPLVERLQALGLPGVVVGDGVRLGQPRLLILQVGALALEGRAGHLEPRLSGQQRGARLLQHRLQLEIVHLHQELTRPDEVPPVGVDAADVPRHLREDGGLLRGDDVGGEGELDVQIPSRGAQHAHQDVGPGAGDRAGLLILEAVRHQDSHQDHEAQHDQADTIPPQVAHGRRVTRRGPGPGEAPGRVNSAQL